MRWLPCGTLLVLSRSRSLVAGVGGRLACRNMHRRAPQYRKCVSTRQLQLAQAASMCGAHTGALY
jgi:hypothetical protein